MLDRTRKRVGHWREREVDDRKMQTEEVNGKSIYLDGHHVTEFLTMLAYEWYCMTMYTCIVLIVNLPTEYKGLDQFMWGREDKQVKHYYVTFS